MPPGHCWSPLMASAAVAAAEAGPQPAGHAVAALLTPDPGRSSALEVAVAASAAPVVEAAAARRGQEAALAVLAAAALVAWVAPPHARERPQPLLRRLPQRAPRCLQIARAAKAMAVVLVAAPT